MLAVSTYNLTWLVFAIRVLSPALAHAHTCLAQTIEAAHEVTGDTLGFTFANPSTFSTHKRSLARFAVGPAFGYGIEGTVFGPHSRTKGWLIALPDDIPERSVNSSLSLQRDSGSSTGIEQDPEHYSHSTDSCPLPPEPWRRATTAELYPTIHRLQAQLADALAKIVTQDRLIAQLANEKADWIRRHDERGVALAASQHERSDLALFVWQMEARHERDQRTAKNNLDSAHQRIFWLGTGYVALVGLAIAATIRILLRRWFPPRVSRSAIVRRLALSLRIVCRDLERVLQGENVDGRPLGSASNLDLIAGVFRESLSVAVQDPFTNLAFQRLVPTPEVTTTNASELPAVSRSADVKQDSDEEPRDQPVNPPPPRVFATSSPSTQRASNTVANTCPDVDTASGITTRPVSPAVQQGARVEKKSDAMSCGTPLHSPVATSKSSLPVVSTTTTNALATSAVSPPSVSSPENFLDNKGYTTVVKRRAKPRALSQSQHAPSKQSPSSPVPYTGIVVPPPDLRKDASLPVPSAPLVSKPKGVQVWRSSAAVTNPVRQPKTNRPLSDVLQNLPPGMSSREANNLSSYPTENLVWPAPGMKVKKGSVPSNVSVAVPKVIAPYNGRGLMTSDHLTSRVVNIAPAKNPTVTAVRVPLAAMSTHALPEDCSFKTVVSPVSPATFIGSSSSRLDTLVSPDDPAQSANMQGSSDDDTSASSATAIAKTWEAVQASVPSKWHGTFDEAKTKMKDARNDDEDKTVDPERTTSPTPEASRKLWSNDRPPEEYVPGFGRVTVTTLPRSRGGPGHGEQRMSKISQKNAARSARKKAEKAEREATGAGLPMA